MSMERNYVIVTFPGNPNRYGVLPEKVKEFKEKYRSILSWPMEAAKEEPKDEIYFLCKMYEGLKQQENVPSQTKETLYVQFRGCMQRMTAEYAAMFGFQVKSVDLHAGGLKKLGCCSHDCRISFNPSLIEYGPTVIRETILHELCHTVHYNYRKGFWLLLQDCLVKAGLTDITGYVIPELFAFRKDYYIVNPITLRYPVIYTGYKKCQKNPDMFRMAKAKDKKGLL